VVLYRIRGLAGSLLARAERYDVSRSLPERKPRGEALRRTIIPVAVMLFFAVGAGAQEQASGAPPVVVLTTSNLPFDTVKLVPPDLGRPASLMRALKERRSVREYDTRPLTLRQLSELLWAANGVNRDDGKRTAPAAVNQQLVDIYVVLPVGAYLYDAPGARLVPVAAGDFRKMAGRQEFVATAPVNLVYVVDPARFKSRSGGPPIPDEEKLNWSRITVGAMAQNVGLYCAAEKLGNVLRGMVDREKLSPALKLRPDEAIILAQTVGALKP
jgi:nitroreductase